MQARPHTLVAMQHFVEQPKVDPRKCATKLGHLLRSSLPPKQQHMGFSSELYAASRCVLMTAHLKGEMRTKAIVLVMNRGLCLLIAFGVHQSKSLFSCFDDGSEREFASRLLSLAEVKHYTQGELVEVGVLDTDEHYVRLLHALETCGSYHRILNNSRTFVRHVVWEVFPTEARCADLYFKASDVAVPCKFLLEWFGSAVVEGFRCPWSWNARYAAPCTVDSDETEMRRRD